MNLVSKAFFILNQYKSVKIISVQIPIRKKIFELQSDPKALNRIAVRKIKSEKILTNFFPIHYFRIKSIRK